MDCLNSEVGKERRLEGGKVRGWEDGSRNCLNSEVGIRKSELFEVGMRN